MQCDWTFLCCIEGKKSVAAVHRLKEERKVHSRKYRGKRVNEQGPVFYHS